MLLPDWVIWGLEEEGTSGIRVYFDASISQKVYKFFSETFTSEWKSALEKVEAKYGDTQDTPSSGLSLDRYIYQAKDYGCFLYFFPLDIRYGKRDFCDLEYGIYALDNSLEALKEEFPTIEYEGLIAYPWSDSIAGDVIQYEVSSKEINPNNDTVYDFVGQAIANHLEGDHLWWPGDDPEVEDCIFVVTGKLLHFENREKITEYIEDLGAIVSDSVSKKTSYLINNDFKSSSAKNKKAKEHGVPIITEDEFICRFGDPDEYDISYNGDNFWSELSRLLDEGDEETFSEVAEFLYAHKEWVSLDNIGRAFNSMIYMLSVINPNIKGSLKEIANRVLAGEKVQTE